jgi:cytochrome P450
MSERGMTSVPDTRTSGPMTGPWVRARCWRGQCVRRTVAVAAPAASGPRFRRQCRAAEHAAAGSGLSGNRPVFRAELPDGRIVWLVSGYDKVRQVIIDQRFSRALAVAPGRAQPGFEMFAAGSINGMDPPEHTRLRKLVASAFTARRVEALRPRVAGIVSELIDAIADRPQPADLVAGFPLPLPARVICEMPGVPARTSGSSTPGRTPSWATGSAMPTRS